MRNAGRNVSIRRYCQRRAGSRSPGGYDLTPRETEVVQLICRGLTNSAISTRLRMRPDTLRTHTRSIYRKLKRRNRVDLVLWIVHEGILTNR